VHYALFIDDSPCTEMRYRLQTGLPQFYRREKARVEPALPLSIEKCGLNNNAPLIYGA
jgi:hypothetical protein